MSVNFMLKKPCLKFPKSATFHTPHPFETYFSENSSDLAQPFFPYLRHLSNLQVYDSGSRGRIIILYYSYDITNCGRVYKTGTLHLIHDDSQKNLENNKTLAKLCMYYCDHKIIFNLSLFPKIFSSRSLSSSFCRRSSWFQMTRWVRLLFGIEKKQSSCVSFDISKICDSFLTFFRIVVEYENLAVLLSADVMDLPLPPWFLTGQ